MPNLEIGNLINWELGEKDSIMEEDQIRIFRKKILLNLRQNRILLIGFIVTILIFSITIIGLLSLIFSSSSLPELELNSFRIVKVEENTIYADLSLNFIEPITQTISIQRIDCKLYQEYNSEDVILANGKTIDSFEILRNKDYVNISFKFMTSSIEGLLQAFLGDKEIGLKGRIYFEHGLSSPFDYHPQKVEVGMFPSIEIIDVHPVSPGTILEIFTEVTNPHEVSLNVTTGNFTLFSSKYGSLGDVSFTNLTIIPKNGNMTFFLLSDETALSWIFEQALNNGTIQAEIRDFYAIIDFAGEDIEISLETSAPFLWQGFSPGLQVLNVQNVTISNGSIAFDVKLGVLGEPLWGYNITPCSGYNWSISFDFYHPLLDEDMSLIGKGRTNAVISVRKFEYSTIAIHINVYPIAASEMIVYWYFNGEIDINIKNGSVCLQFYEIEMQINFEYQLKGFNLN